MVLEETLRTLYKLGINKASLILNPVRAESDMIRWSPAGRLPAPAAPLSCAAAERKSKYLMARLEEVKNKYKYSTPAAEKTIKELKGQLEQARGNDTRSYEEEIHNRLIHAEENMLESRAGWVQREAAAAK